MPPSATPGIFTVDVCPICGGRARQLAHGRCVNECRGADGVIPRMVPLRVVAVVDLPTINDVHRAAWARGFTVDGFDGCSIQGVLIAYSRPVWDGEHLFGLPVAGPRVEREIIERHYTPDVEASAEVQGVTAGRACQRAIWEMEADDA